MAEMSVRMARCRNRVLMKCQNYFHFNDRNTYKILLPKLFQTLEYYPTVSLMNNDSCILLQELTSWTHH